MESLLYLKYIAVGVLVCLTVGLTFLMIRKLASFLIAVLTLGMVSAICAGITNGEFTSWSQIVGVSIAAGFVVSLVCVPLLPFAEELSQSTSQGVNGQKITSESTKSSLPG